MKKYTEDEKFMALALKEAKKAKKIDEVPIGAVLVLDGKVIAKGYNKRESTNDPTMHAEIVAIRKACKEFNSWRLVNCTLYVTIEPCSMCAGTLLWSRVKRIVYGANDPKGGALGSSYNLFEQPHLNHHPEITGGVLKDRCSKIVSNYFKSKRN